MQLLTKATVADFDAIYRLLHSSFPVDELRSYDDQLALMTKPGFTVYVTKDISAVITLWELEDFAFIEHFAVDTPLRGKGLGASLLRELLTNFSCPVCLEAELPETELASRRLNFYRRNGFAVNLYPYIQPSYGPGRSSVPLLILTAGGSIQETEFLHIRDVLYRDVYHTTP